MGNERKTILAIDDDITVLNSLRTVLEAVYEVSLAKNTEIARKILDTTGVDLILLDMNMPGTSGMDFLEYVRNDDAHYHIPVIIVSSQGTADIIVEIKKKGAADFVVKPVSPNILREKIRSCLKMSGVRTDRDSLERRLKRLASACAVGNSGRVEEAVEDLKQTIFEKNIDAEIAGICKYAGDMEYNLVEEKARQLLARLRLMPKTSLTGRP